MKSYRLMTLFIGSLSGLGLLLIALRFDPSQTTILVRFIFFISIFLMFWGLGTFIFSFVRRTIFPKALRRGFVLAIIPLILIFLKRITDVSFVGVAAVILFAIGIELAFSYFVDHGRYFDDFS